MKQKLLSLACDIAGITTIGKQDFEIGLVLGWTHRVRYLEPLNNAPRVHAPGPRQFMNQADVGNPSMADAGKHVEVIGSSRDGVRNHAA